MDFLIAAITLVSLDSAYIYFMTDYFNNQIKLVQGSPISLNLFGAFICYIFIIFGLYYFIIKRKRSVNDAFLLGMVVYAVYEFTNLATLKNWSIFTAIMDTIWGGVLFALTTGVVYKIDSIF